MSSTVQKVLSARDAAARVTKRLAAAQQELRDAQRKVRDLERELCEQGHVYHDDVCVLDAAAVLGRGDAVTVSSDIASVFYDLKQRRVELVLRFDADCEVEFPEGYPTPIIIGKRHPVKAPSDSTHFLVELTPPRTPAST